jgi:hypothetical protein
LEFPVLRFREVADVVVFRADIAKVRLPHRVSVDQRHAPDRRLYRAPLDGASGKVFRGEILCLG